MLGSPFQDVAVAVYDLALIVAFGGFKIHRFVAYRAIEFRLR